MKGLDWIVFLMLIGMGVSCLTMSATWMIETDSVQSYFKNILQICLWMGMPALILGIVYYIVKRKGRDS